MLRIPGVEIISEIGQGARGVVYRGSARGREVAVKVPLLANSSQQVHFCREGSLLACVSHPGLAQVFEVGLLDAQVYILTEFLEGATLAEELRHSPLSLARAEQLGLCLSGALAAIHQQGLVHRDIKPSNIVCTSHGPKLIDFGLAVRGDAAQTPFAGTLLYASPEQIGILKRPVDHRSDLYSLGVVLFECLAGRPPFWGEPADLVRQHAAVKPPDLRDLNPRVPHTLAAIVAKLLAKDPADRYASAAGLEADFHHLAQLQPDRLDQTAPAPPPLLGRETWLSELRGFWDAVRCLETGQLLLISGPAGAGKSSLLRHWLAEPQGAPVRLYLKCQEGEATPYQTARQAVEEMLSQLARLPAEGQTSARRRLLAANLRWATALTAFSSKFADLFGEVGSAGEACGDELPQALVEWLLSFARACGGMVVVMEDVHWLDEGSRQVLDRLQQRLEEAPLLMVLSSRQDSPAALRLEPLAEPEVEKMLSHLLGGAELPGELVAQMIQRTGSNPLAIQQFVRACLDQGVLRPSWGSWRVDQELLGRLRLPEDIYALILFRLEGLGAECARVLRVGAIQGNAFSLQVVAAVLEMDPLQVELALQTAIWEGLIERCPKRNLFQFAHDCLRQALTSGLPPEHLGQLHRQVAAVLEGDSSQVYAVARHYWLGGAEPARIWQTSLKAARQALADFAFESAYEFLQNCETAQSGREDRLDYLDCLAQACEMTGRADRAYELLAEAIHLEQNALRRAQFRLRRCQLGLTNPDWGAGGRELQTALAEVGARRLPGGWRSLLAALPTFVRWRWLPSGRPTPAGRIRAQLYQQLAQVSFFRADLPTMVEAMARSALTSARLGPSRELVRAYCLLAFLAALLKRERESERCMARAQEIADQLGDRLIQRTVLAFQGVSQFNLDRVEAAHQSFVEALFGEGPRLPMGDYTLILGAYCLSLILRGAHREIVQALQHVHRAFGQSESGLPPEFRVLQWNQVVARAALARPGECPPSLEHQSGGARLNFLHRGNQLLVELFEGTACQVELLQELDRELVGRARDPVYLQAGYVAWTYAAYYRVLASEAAYRQEPTRLFERALKQLRLQLHYRVTSGHQACLQAALARLRGHFWQARQQLQRAEWIAHETDSPWLLWEVLAERSRLLASQGYAQGSRQVATRAQRLAQEQGWLKRAEAFAREASLVLTSSGVRESLAPSASSQMLSGLLQRRQIEALLQLSQASARILEPDRLAQIVLAEILKLFGGQRAVLVLGEREDYEVLAARTQEGPCPPQQVGYSKSLVSQVLTTGKSVLVNGNLQDNLGKSVVLQDLRSLMAVPLRLRNQLLGAVYLDSDQAHGLFSSDDQEILEGLASHIAVGLETARAMQMEVQLGREQHQRAWAEQLRDFAAQLVSATEVRQVFATLAERLQPVTLTGLVWRAEQLELAEGGSLESETWQLARRALASGQPEGQGRLWAVPCRSQQAPVGVFLLEDASQGQRELAETLSGYVGLALQKAVLFEQMHRIAHTDALTGIANRRHFFAMAEAHQGEGCLILLDVDHFKSFNDRFGHDVGDLVLQSVARGLWSELGPQALLARYGGEEFVVLLPGLELSAAFEVAERLRLAVPAQSEGPYQCHISLGLAERQPGEDLNSLLKRADEALYRAKAKGRNRCVVARL